jgi:thiopeptide-type bacteriocin biosynthesis protein
MTAALTASRPVAAAPAGRSEGRERSWCSWHLHVGTFDPQALENLVTGVVAPTVAELARRDRDAGGGESRPWFFMRYWQNGPHVRFRVADLDDEGARWVNERLRRWHADAAPAGPAGSGTAIGEDDYHRVASQLAAAGEGNGALELGSLQPPGVHVARYEPEIQRYGGTLESMATSEDLFRLSSGQALRACLLRDGHRGNLGDGLEAMAATVAAWPGEPAGVLTAVRDNWTEWLRTAAPGVADSVAVFARRRADALAGQARAVRGLIDGGPSRWSVWTVPLAAAARDWVDRLGRAGALGVFASHLHMTQNRLGVGAGREAHLAATLLNLLEISTQNGGTVR